MKGKCRLGVAYGYESDLYSFPDAHPLNNRRVIEYASSLRKIAADRRVSIIKPVPASEEDLILFHTKEYVDFVKESSQAGSGYLDYGDTPSFKGVFEASLFTVGSSLYGLSSIVDGNFDHFFNPIGGLHHARRERAGGFCVFNDCAVTISRAINVLKMKKVAYVDIDAHHGDGVYYGFEYEPRVIIGDIHEDGRFLYPGTGFGHEKGKGSAEGTKLNLPLNPGAVDVDFIHAFDQIESFLRSSKVEFIFFQCGADGLKGDPLTHLAYTSEAHAYAARRLHLLSHEICGGRILAMGGGGYNRDNVGAAWSAVTLELGGNI